MTPVPATAAAPAWIGIEVASAHRVMLDIERPSDAGARERLLDRAFGPGRFGKTCERLRAGRLPAAGLSLVARAVGGAERAGIVGTVRLWHVAAGERGCGVPVPALMLGPLAVAEEWRRHRLGARLMALAIGHARLAGHGAILLVGDEPYYRRFGFTRAPEGLRLPGPVEAERFLALELRPGALAGARGAVRPTGAVDLARYRGPGAAGRRAA